MAPRCITLLLTAGLALSPLLVSAPAQAALPKPVVSFKVSATSVTVGDLVKFTGRVSKNSARAPIALQQKTEGEWVTVDRERVSPNRSYKFTQAAVEGPRSYRVKVSKTRKIQAAISPRVRVVARPLVVDEPPVPDPDVTLAEVQQLILDQTNELRVSQGLQPLAPMSELQTVAQNWSVHMATTGDFSHNPTYSQEYPEGWYGAAENIAAGYSPETVVKAWANSPGHRANMLGAYTHLGVGYVKDAQGYAYYTQNFAAY